MKQKAIFSILIFILALLEASILNSFKLLGVAPNLLLISVVIAAVIFDLRWALVFALLSGILKDSLGAGSFGLNTLLFPLWAFLIIRLSREIPLDSNILRTVLVFIVVILHNLLKKLIFFMLGASSVSIGMFIYISLMESIYTAAILPVLFKLIEHLIHPIIIE